MGRSPWEAERLTSAKLGRREEGRPLGRRPLGGRPLGRRPLGGRPLGGRPLGGRVERFEPGDGWIKYSAMARGREPCQAQLGCKIW